MCIFITAALSPDAKVDEIVARAKTFELTLQPIENESVLTYLKDGSHYFYTTNGMCDCGTLLGISNRVIISPVRNLVRTIKRLQQKGWSETKIENWLLEKDKIIARDMRIKNDFNEAKELNRWLGFIRDIIRFRLTSTITLLLHSYHKSVDNESIFIKGVINTNVKSLSEDVLLNLHEDRLYQFY